MRAPLFGVAAIRLVGVFLIALGVVVLLDSYLRFVRQGIGTPAPVFPTRHLVVSGLYRNVRNPIYLAVASVILGQGLVLGSLALVVYSAVFWLACHAFVLIYEEPTLRRTFGTEYADYCANVPRWLPRLRRWTGG